MTLFRRWQGRWIDASLKAPTIRESGAFKIGPPPNHDTRNNILQFEVIVTWESPSTKIKKTHSATGVETQHDKLHVEGEKLFSHNDQWDAVFDKVISRHGAGALCQYRWVYHTIRETNRTSGFFSEQRNPVIEGYNRRFTEEAS